jgi:hypothetical protein
MADKDDKKAKKPGKGGPEAEQAGKSAKGDKAPKAAQAGKGDKAAKAGDKAGGEKAGGEKVARAAEERVPARLKVEFDQKIRSKLTEQFGYQNRMQVPVLDKIVINMGIGEGVADRKKVDAAAADLALISGQKVVITKARKSIATYKLRDGQAIGCKVTLRKARMYEFLDRLINIAQSKELRRSRQLLARHQRAHRVPGNRLRQDVGSLGHGHHRLHHRAQRRRSARAVDGIQFSVPAVRRQGPQTRNSEEH